MHKRVWNMLLSLCLAAALLCSTYAFAADTADEGQPANSVVLSDGEEPENGTVPSDGEEPHEHDYVAGKCACGDILPEYEWYYGSTGTSYSIGSAGEMAALAVLVNGGESFSGKTVTLSCDIDLSTIANWTPIGDAEKIYLSINGQEELSEAAGIYKVVYDDVGNSYTTSDRDAPYADGRLFYYVNPTVFSGTFDGGGHTISGLSLSTDLGYAGLFGNVNGVLRDFTVSGTVTYTGANGDYIGGAAGMLSMGGTISGVISEVNVNADWGYNVGGIAGFVGTPLSAESANNTTVTMCVNKGAVIGYKKVGGIVGENAGIVSLCVNNGSVNGKNNSTKNGIGGIVGRNGCNNAAVEKGTVTNCYNTGEVNLSAAQWCGGIVGFNDAISSVTNCYSITCPKNGGGHCNPIIGKDESSTGVVENNYALHYYGINYTGMEEHEIGIQMTSDGLKASADLLGSAYTDDSYGINQGYPVFLWQTLQESEYTVTVDSRTGTKAPAEITRLMTRYSEDGSNAIFTVTCALTCVAAATTDGGATYTRLTASANEDGSYDFSVLLTADTEITVAILGDVNGDGRILANDVLRIQRYLDPGSTSNNTLDPLTMLMADVNGDGRILANDVLRIQRYLDPGSTSNNTLNW